MRPLSIGLRFVLVAAALTGLGCPREMLPVPSRSATPPEPEREPRMPCDNIHSEQPAPAPPPTTAVCGNGVIDALAGTCTEICNGGCDTPITCRVECTTPRETCDGKDVSYSCEAAGFAGGVMACTSECGLDDSRCVACVPGPGVRCGAAELRGDEAHVVVGARGAAVFARGWESGDVVGARVDATLRARPFTGLPRGTLAAAALDGRLGYVDSERRFGVIDPVRGRAKVLGPIGEDSSPVLILRETFAGGAAVLTGDGQRRTLAVFDPPGGAPAGPRHFYIGNLRIVVIPASHELARSVTKGDLVVIVWGGQPLAYQRDGLELIALPSVPPGIEFTFTYPSYTDAVRWSTGALTTTRRTDPDTNAPPAGLSRAALSGVGMSAAFGGVLIANPHHGGDRPRTELYWITGADPTAPSNTSTPAP